jgi:short-subunit dehydrogenase
MVKILITGATSGIGRALALQYAHEGAELILNGRNGQSLHDIFIETSKLTKVKFVLADLATFEGVQALLAVIREELPDQIINSAGFGAYGETISMPEQTLQEMIAVNCAALVAITRDTAHLWKEKGLSGTILNVSSVVGLLPAPYAALYAATKAFVLSFSEALDVELEPHGIRVLVSCPGTVATAFAERASHGKFRHAKEGGMILSAESVAESIRAQIKEKKPVVIVDWKFRLLLFFTKILPTRFCMKLLGRALKQRIA